MKKLIIGTLIGLVVGAGSSYQVTTHLLNQEFTQTLEVQKIENKKKYLEAASEVYEQKIAKFNEENANEISKIFEGLSAGRIINTEDAELNEQIIDTAYNLTDSQSPTWALASRQFAENQDYLKQLMCFALAAQYGVTKKEYYDRATEIMKDIAPLNYKMFIDLNYTRLYVYVNMITIKERKSKEKALGCV